MWNLNYTQVYVMSTLVCLHVIVFDYTKGKDSMMFELALGICYCMFACCLWFVDFIPAFLYQWQIKSCQSTDSPHELALVFWPVKQQPWRALWDAKTHWQHQRLKMIGMGSTRNRPIKKRSTKYEKQTWYKLMQNLKYILYSVIFSHLLVMCLWAWKARNFELLSQSGQEVGTYFCPRAEWRRIQFAQPELYNRCANICQMWSTQPHNLRFIYLHNMLKPLKSAEGDMLEKMQWHKRPRNSGQWSTRQAVWSHHPSPPTPVLHIPDNRETCKRVKPHKTMTKRQQELERKRTLLELGHP